jgi:hypothetical protein
MSKGKQEGPGTHLPRPRLTPELILAWADAHKARTGEWPKGRSGPVADAPGETWKGLDLALLRGSRGLPGGDTLIRLLRRERGLSERRGRGCPETAPARRQQAVFLRAAGLTQQEIGRRLGVSYQAVQQMLRRAGPER